MLRRKSHYLKTIFLFSFCVLLIFTPLTYVGLFVTTNTLSSQSSCPGAPPSRMAVGMTGRVTFTDGTTTRLRSAPTTQADIIFEMPEGLEFVVVGGSECAGNYTWWQLQLSDGTIGWSAEGDSTNYFIEPLPQQVTSVPTSAPISQPVALDTSEELISFAQGNNSIWVGRADGSVIIQIPTMDFGASRFTYPCPDLSPNGRYVAMGGLLNLDTDPIYRIVIADLLTGQTWIIDGGTSFDWSPDGTKLAYDRFLQFGENGELPDVPGIWIYDPASGTEEQLIAPPAGNPLALPSWSPDGSKIGFAEMICCEGGGNYIIANSDGSNQRTQHSAFDWSSDGTQMVVTEVNDAPYESIIYITDAQGMNAREIVRIPDVAASHLVWSPNGRFVSFVDASLNAFSPPQSLWITDVQTGQLRQIVEFTVGEARWSPNSQYLAFTEVIEGSPPQALWIADVQSGNLRRLAANEIRGFAWSPDGTRLVSSVADQIQVLSLDGNILNTFGQGNCPEWIRPTNEIPTEEALTMLLSPDFTDSPTSEQSAQFVHALFDVGAPFYVSDETYQLAVIASNFLKENISGFNPIFNFAFIANLDETFQRALPERGVSIVCFIVGLGTDQGSSTIDTVDVACVWIGMALGDPFAWAQAALDPGTYIDIWLDPLHNTLGRISIECYILKSTGTSPEICRQFD